jgi:crotonobetainyl-CoA:carnitine CoA-transferase CaiB-like acyl-CoA transferase
LTDDEAVYLLAGKRRVELPPGELGRLALEADIVLEDQAPGTLASWGWGPAELRAQRPELVVVSITPFGQDGPYAGFQATNAVSFAMGGIMSLTGSIEREPLVTGGSQAQMLGGLNAAGAALCAYYGRLLQGEGDWVDLSLQELAAGMNELYVPGTAYGGPVQLRLGNQTRPVWGIYPCADGWAGVFCLERQIPAFFGLLDDPELDEERFRDPILRQQQDDELTAKVYGFFAGRTKAEVLELGPRHRVPFGVAVTPSDLLESPGLAERGFFETVDTPDGPVTMPGRPFPGLGWRSGDLHAPGADTEAVLADWSADVPSRGVAS